MFFFSYSLKYQPLFLSKGSKNIFTDKWKYFLLKRTIQILFKIIKYLFHLLYLGSYLFLQITELVLPTCFCIFKMLRQVLTCFSQEQSWTHGVFHVSIGLAIPQRAAIASMYHQAQLVYFCMYFYNYILICILQICYMNFKEYKCDIIHLFFSALLILGLVLT